MPLTIRLLVKEIERSLMAKPRPMQLKDALVETEYTGERPVQPIISISIG
jgi:hypothetical protein